MSKYGNLKQVVDGITFDSKREVDYYLNLKLLKKAGEVTDIEFHPKYVLQPGYRKCCGHIWLDKPDYGMKGATVCGNCKKKMPKTSAITYSADFGVTYKDGHTEIIDVKGMETEAFKIKRKMFEFKYPELALKTIKKGGYYRSGTGDQILI
jgi:hypothetical protein